MYNGEGAQVTSIYRLLLFESGKEAAGNLGFSCYRIVARRSSRGGRSQKAIVIRRLSFPRALLSDTRALFFGRHPDANAFVRNFD
jgi:hypothetical protein